MVEKALQRIEDFAPAQSPLCLSRYNDCMSVHSLKSAFWVIFSAFAGLVLLASGATFLSLNAHQQDALVINLAGRQRMLLQQITRQLIGLSLLPDETAFLQVSQVTTTSDTSLRDQQLAELLESLQLFEQTLAALLYGGQTYSLDADPILLMKTRDIQARQLLGDIQQDWGQIRPSINLLLTTQPGTTDFTAALDRVQQATFELTEQSDDLVLRFEQIAQSDLNQLRLIQMVYLSLAGIVIVWGVWLMRRKVLIPLHEINHQAKMIAQGRLDQPFQAGGLSEIEQISITMEAMRQEILNWQELLEFKVTLRTQELEVFSTVSQEITANLHLEQVLQSITDKTRQLLRCEVAFLCLHDVEQESLHLNSASCGENFQPNDNHHQLDQDGGNPKMPFFDAGGHAAFSLPVLQRCNISSCTSANSRWTPSSTFPANQVLQGNLVDASWANNGHSPHCQVLEARFQASHMAAPLISGKQVFGALCAGSSQSNFFNDEDRRLLTRLAGVASLALQNARLFRQAEQLAVLEERQHVAAEIHDGFIQTVNTIRLLQEQLDAELSSPTSEPNKISDILSHMRRAAVQAEQEARKALASLHEEPPPALTLQEQLGLLAKEMSLPSQLIGFHSKVNLPLLFNPQTTEQVIRIAREAVANAQKHARAVHIQLNLDLIDDSIQILIQDDGTGFRIGKEPEKDDRSHFGLQVMEARAQRIGAILEIDTLPGSGTRVSLLLPMDLLINRREEHENTHTAGR